MRSRRATPQHQEAISRRLALLSAELADVRTQPASGPTLPAHGDLEGGADADDLGPWRPADPELAAAFRPWGPTAFAPEPDDDLNVLVASGPGFPGRHAARRRGPSLATVLPQTVRHRWALGPAHLAVLAVIVAVGLGLTAWWAIVSRPQEVARADSLVAQIPTSESPLLDGASEPSVPEDPVELVVDVSGKVRRPGIAVLEPGARVVDALEAAGGARPGADLGSLNLARPVIDGEQILVGVPQATGVGAAAAAASGTGGLGALVNINIADQPQLETLPGIGPVTAQSIMAWRTEHNGFGAVEELLDVQGIGEATLAQLAPYVTV